MYLSLRHRVIRRLACRRFTLIEIMVVVLIIGMILGLVGVGAVNQLNKAKVKNTRNQELILVNAIKSYSLDVGKNPSQLQDLVTNPGLGNKWKGPYLDPPKVPKDAWENEFVYQEPGSNGTAFDIYSYGADNAPGGEGFNADIYPFDENNEG